MIGIGPLAGWMRKRRAVRRRFNPYVAGTPVFDPELFVGRTQLARHTLRVLESRSVKLVGERRIGKTSFLHHLCGLLARDEAQAARPFPVFVDLEAATAPLPYRALMEETLEALALPPGSRAGLRFASRNGYDARDFSHDMRRLVEELRRRAQRPARLVLLVDEIDVLGGAPGGPGDLWLRPLLEDCREELRVVLAGVRRNTKTASANESAAALDEVKVEPLSAHEAEELVTRPVAGVFEYQPLAVERILERSRLRPYLIQALCRQAVDRMLDEGRTSVRLADVEASGGPRHRADTLLRERPSA
jgi:hypothetical protein